VHPAHTSFTCRSYSYNNKDCLLINGQSYFRPCNKNMHVCIDDNLVANIIGELYVLVTSHLYEVPNNMKCIKGMW
jgi:hypothetical protein